MKGKLRDLLRNEDDDSAVAMNVLDLPLGKTPVPVPPMYDDLASDAYSVNHVKHLLAVKDLSDTTSWGTAATRNAVSWFHIDDIGLATSAWVQAGSKWWVLARKKKNKPRSDEADDSRAGEVEDPPADEVTDIRIFNNWNVETIDTEQWDLEAVHLTRNCVL